MKILKVLRGKKRRVEITTNSQYNKLRNFERQLGYNLDLDRMNLGYKFGVS